MTKANGLEKTFRHISLLKISKQLSKALKGNDEGW